MKNYYFFKNTTILFIFTAFFCPNFGFAQPFGCGNDIIIGNEIHIVGDCNVVSGGSISITQNIVIHTGAHLDLTFTYLRMSRDTRIIVRHGASLRLSQSSITGNPNWIGVEVWGSPTATHPTNNVDIINDVYPSNDPAVAQGQQGTVYLNRAIIADAHNAFATKSYTQGGQWGGIIIAENFTTFRDNRRTVEFLQFLQDNISSFTECDFYFNYFSPGSFADSDFKNFVSMWDVHGVEFIDCNLFLPETFELEPNKRAFYSINADYLFTEGSIVNTPKGLVADDTQTTTGSIEITDNRFLGRSYFGTLWTGVQNGVFVDNDYYFSITKFYDDPISTNDLQNNYMKSNLLMDACSGYTISNNNFNASISSPSQIPSNSNHTGIFVKNKSAFINIIDNNVFNELSQGITGLDDNIGLQIRCNNFLNQVHESNVYVNGTLAHPQGVCTLFEQIPAGNQFSAPCANFPVTFNFAANNSLTYFYEDNNGNAPQFNPKVGNCAPSNLIEQICNRENCAEEAFSAMNNECNDFPDCYDNTLQELNEDIAYYQQELEKATIGSSEYKELELTINSLISGKGLFINDLIQYAVKEKQITKIIDFLTEEADVNIQKIRMELLFANKQYDDLLSSLLFFETDNEEDLAFKQYYTTLINIHIDGSTYFDMTPVELNTIRVLSETETFIAQKAKNVLKLVEGDTFNYDIHSESAKWKPSEKNQLAVQLFPNPARNYLNLTVNSFETIHLSYGIYDLYGRLVVEHLIENTQTQINLENIPEGMYLIVLKDRGQIFHTQKLNVLK